MQPHTKTGNGSAVTAVAHLAVRVAMWLAVLLCLALPVSAHFQLNLNVRIFHVEHLADGLRVHVRMPMPYLVANLLGPTGADGLPAAAPFTSNRKEADKLVHYVDADALRAEPTGLGKLAERGLDFIVDGERLNGRVEAVRVHRVGDEPPFATLDEAKTAIAKHKIWSDGAGATYVGDAVVDVVLRYEVGTNVTSYAISSSLDPGLPGQELTANLILDYAPGGTKVFRARGLLAEPIGITRSTLAAVTTFVKEGVRHILEGLDHVLFVLCLVLGATQLKSLVWRATGFTIGHSITLTAGFFGYVPSGAWFVPSVETGIALSIVYAAAIAVLGPGAARRTELQLFAVTTAIGLLHGLGFSFVLHEILKVDSPNIWQSLLAFNVGVEIGQVIIILATWPVFRLMARLNQRSWEFGRFGIALACGAIAMWWAGERALLVLETLS